MNEALLTGRDFDEEVGELERLGDEGPAHGAEVVVRLQLRRGAADLHTTPLHAGTHK